MRNLRCIGTTTDTNFKDNASGLASEASANNADGASTRAALAALSVVRTDLSTAVADQFKLYDAATGQGITSHWIADRAAFTANYYAQQQRGDGILQGTTNVAYVDKATGIEVLVGSGNAQRVQFQFGGDAADTFWESDDKATIYLQQGADLLTGQRAVAGASTVAGTITVKNWTRGQLGISLEATQAPRPTGALIYNGDQHAQLNSDGNYNWEATSWAANGTLVGGLVEANFNDVICGTARNETLNGLGGNDALDGGLHHDVNENTPHLIAIYADCSWAAAQFDGKTRHCKAQKQTFQDCTGRSSVEPSYALSMQLAEHKGLGRRIGSAQARSHEGAA